MLYNISLQLIYFIHSSLYLLIPYSYLALPPSLFPPVTTSLFCLSVSLFLFCYLHLLASFLDSTYKWYHTIFVSLHLTYFPPRSIHVVENARILFFYGLVECSHIYIYIYCFSVAKSCVTLCDPMDCSTPGSSVLHCLPEFAQIHVHWVSSAI